MGAPVDLTNLRSITEGNKDIEQMLFEEFLSSSDAALATLASQCTDGANEIWRSTAHAMKGTALNLGAEKLGELCKTAQETSAATAADKASLLHQIQTEYTLVKAFLNAATTE